MQRAQAFATLFPDGRSTKLPPRKKRKTKESKNMKSYQVGKLASGNIGIICDGEKFCKVLTGKSAGQIIANANFPEHAIKSNYMAVSAESLEAAVGGYDPQIAELQHDLRRAEDLAKWNRQAFNSLTQWKHSLTSAKLKKMAAAAAKREAAARVLKRFAAACARAAAKLPSAPALPMKGVGNARADFSFRLVGRAQVLLAAIPSAHKTEVASRRAGNHFSFAPAISPEAAKAFGKLIATL